ncbi:hypothetical protein HC251_21150 [Iamia sp. SCSIO 61187]|uniref:hypothetical protein n=1 Tax=Iamia sp. SCSIO 61187 TaxID=2722752 RepID=UPI001C631773|nr:hypothetical protein [Iamia sp. SCSIO 61187]QYG94694.1 hypothetical protein HC251_21150 [Iamia sp. SCSIO 61187]
MLTLTLAQTPSAGGAPVGEVVGASAVALASIVAVVALGVAHRRRGVLDPFVQVVEERTGRPAWSIVPVLITLVSLAVAVWGYYWDVSWHIDRGRDEGAFANPAHWFIIIGLDGIAFAALLAMVLGDDRSPSAVRLTDRWKVPVGGIMLTACSLIALAGFPLDDIWHRLFGQDVTAWGPTHIQLIGGASLATLGCWALLIEGARAMPGTPPTRFAALRERTADITLAGAFLVGLSTLQVEFDFGVPQFRALYHPTLLALAGGLGLVAARIRLGRGGALMAVGGFLALRGALSLGVELSGRSTFHFPLYIGSALAVEGVFLWLRRQGQVTVGAAAGLAVGTVGMAAEALWSQVWMPIPWTTALLPDALVVCVVAGTAGGALGGLVGRALAPEAAERQPVPAWAAPVAWLGAVGVIAFCLPIGAPEGWSGDIAVGERRIVDGVEVADVTVTPSPGGAAAAARDGVLFEVLSWQGAAEGGDGGSSMVDLVPVGDGAYRTEAPVPVSGSAKTMVRLQTKGDMVSAPIFMPADEALGLDALPAEDGEVAFVADKQNLQREARTDRVALERAAYVVIALLAGVWMVALSWGLARLDPASGSRPSPRLRPTGSPAPA